MNSKLKHIKNWPELALRSKWSAGALAKSCGVSRASLHRHFHQHFRKTPKVWLAELRQNEAIELLRDGSTIKEAAGCLGYKQQTNFTRPYGGKFGSWQLVGQN
jgi:AraC-like DNA-binding protein